MACPAVKSGANWLDRLRSSKGFPSHHAGLDLDHFLHLPPNPDANPSPSPPPPQDPALDCENPPRLPQQRRGEEAGGVGGDGKQWFDLVSSALAELFHMGDPRELRPAPVSKNSRKQPNPRICVVSAPASNASSCPAGEQGGCGGSLRAMSPPSAENSTAGAKKSSEGRTKARRKRAPCRSVGDSSDLSAYSHTEVTVIDTSSPSWKLQKIIFRKGLLWKVRDKKVWNVCRKKRKLGIVKRLAGEKEQEGIPLGGKKEASGKEHFASSTYGHSHNDRRDISKDISCNQNQNPERRQVCYNYVPFQHFSHFHVSLLLVSSCCSFNFPKKCLLGCTSRDHFGDQLPRTLLFPNSEFLLQAGQLALPSPVPIKENGRGGCCPKACRYVEGEIGQLAELVFVTGVSDKGSSCILLLRNGLNSSTLKLAYSIVSS